MEHKGTFYPNGPGTELKTILSGMGFKERQGCSCGSYAATMNAKGPEWCLNNLEKIVDWLAKSAKQRELPFSRMVARQLVKKAVKRHKQNMGTNMNLKNYFQRVYCVNLDRRKDRWQKFKNQVPAGS